MKTKLFCLIAGLLGITVQGCAQSGWQHPTELPAALTVQVYNEEGDLISGESVSIDFISEYSSRKMKIDERRGSSDKEGKFYAAGHSNTGNISTEVGRYGLGVEGKQRREEYYRSGMAFSPIRNNVTIAGSRGIRQ